MSAFRQLGDQNNHRVATRLGTENIDVVNILVGLLPGVQVTYYGEEIGMEDGEVSFDEGDDPNGCKNETLFDELSRDFERTPFHWDTTENAGFSDSDTTWLPVSKKYKEINLATESAEGVNSHYHVYQEVVKLRQKEPFKTGKMKLLAVSNDILALKWTLQGYDPYIVIINFGNGVEFLNVTDVFGFTTDWIETILSSTGSSFVKGQGKRRKRETQSDFLFDRSLSSAQSLKISPHEGLVARVILKGNENWWKNAVFYQIYVRSFKDSDADGIGDLKGVISKISRLDTFQVDAIWLSSMYKSPQTNFKSINDEYGTMEDLEELLEEAHRVGIKVIVDFIPNHSSSQHEWFTLSENRTDGYDDYYVWKDPVYDGVPNNWVPRWNFISKQVVITSANFQISLYKNSAWKYSEKRKQYYLHQFGEEEPDLNYRCDAVVQEMMVKSILQEIQHYKFLNFKDVMVFWLDKGVDGFVVDSAPFLFEHKEFKDEPLSGENVDTNDYKYLSHIYTKDQTETLDMIYKFRQLLDYYTLYRGGDSRSPFRCITL